MTKENLQKEYNNHYHNYECKFDSDGDYNAIKEMVEKYGIEACKNIKRKNAFYDLKNLEKNIFEFQYQMLSRLKMDCEYYLGCGERNKKVLWALDEKEQIIKMKALWNEVNDKPEWLTMEQILSYEKEMCI